MSRTLWRARVGRRGARVTVAERALGGPVYLFAGAAKRSLKFRVRGADGRLIREAVDRAKAQAAELSRQLFAGELPRDDEQPGLTLGEVLSLFERDVLAQQAPRTQEGTKAELKLWRAVLGEAFELARLDSQTWNAFKRQRAAGTINARGQPATKPRPVGPRAVAKSLKVLRQICLFATTYRLPTGETLLAADPTRGLELPESDGDPQRPLMNEQRYTKLLAVAEPALRAALVIAHETGRRINAIVGLRWTDWNPKGGLHGILTWRAERDKRHRTWVVPVTEAVQAALAGLRRKGEWIFPAPHNAKRPVSRQVAARWLRAAEERAELPHVPRGGWHTFRRKWATSRKALPISDVKYAGGWTDTKVLTEIYTLPDEETLQAVVDGAQPGLRAVK